MATKLKVNPTRMELRRLKTRKKTAVRGHKLLKDKSDEMIRQFMVLARENKRLRLAVESDLANSLKSFMLAKAISDDAVIQEAVAMPTAPPEIEVSTRNVMSVNIPTFKIKSELDNKLPYSYISTTAELDTSVSKIKELVHSLIKLAETEKACDMLAFEIEKNRRRVNALEYVMIPQTTEAIKDITMKLDENERGNIVRLMKVKTLIANKKQ